MTNGELVRVSDTERDRAVGFLREHLAQGRLSLEEFTARMTDAYSAKTTADLDVLLRDLPSERPKRKPTRFVISLVGSSERQGRLRLRNQLWCIAGFGNIDVDLRQATLEGDVITIVALGFMGAIDVYVPEGVEADIRGLTVFGHKNANGNDVPPRPGTPLIRMVAFGLFVGIDLWRVPVAWAKHGWGEVIRAIEKGEHKELAP
ncbi:MAG TPA: DUF1707 domain-containing protein [Gaiellaceae bacterium]|jgi:hypothetical protein